MRKLTVPLIAVALTAIGLAGMAVTESYVRSATPDPAPRASRVDAMFIEQMIPHHDDAIEMAKLARTRAEHPEIERLAADVERTQAAENAQMRDWYREWFGTAVPERGSSQMMGGMMGPGTTGLADLEDAEPFDKAFIEAMIPHHRMGIMMSQMASNASNRPEMRNLTSSIIETQSREIDEMQAWYEEWYGR